MNIHSISARNPINAKGSPGSAEDSQIKNLEQKLLQLNKEKDKAQKAKALDKVRELEQKIQEIERRLEELRKKKDQKENERTETDASPSQSRNSSDTGNYVDEIV